MLIQFVSLEATWPSDTPLPAVNITGTLKKTLVTPGGEAVISSLVMITPVHFGTTCENPRRLDKVLKTLENCVLVSSMVLDFSPPGIL